MRKEQMKVVIKIVSNGCTYITTHYIMAETYHYSGTDFESQQQTLRYKFPSRIVLLTMSASHKE